MKKNLPNSASINGEEMEGEIRRSIADGCRIIAQIASAWLVLIGLSVLLGWEFHSEVLKRVHPSWEAMNPLSAVCFILAGIALHTVLFPKSSRRRRWLGLICGGAITVIGIEKLLEYTFGWNLGLDQVLFREQLSHLRPLSNQMPPNNALGIAYAGLALLSAEVKTPLGFRLTQLFSLSVLFISLSALVGFLYHVQFLYRVGFYNAMAFQSALGLFALSLGLLCANPNRGVIKILFSNYSGSVAARRLLPVVILLPLLLDGLRVIAEHKGIIEFETGTALHTVIYMAGLVALIIWVAISLNRTDRERTQAETVLRESEERIRRIIENAQDAFVAIEEGGTIMDWNPKASLMFGQNREEALGKSFYEAILPSRNLERQKEKLLQLISGNRGNAGDMRAEILVQRKDGAEFPAEVTLSMTRVGKKYVFYLFIHDITQRRKAENEIAILNRKLMEQVDRLKATNRELEAFSYSVSHDLRAPLRHIEGFVALLQKNENVQNDPDCQRHMEVIATAARRMAGLIDDLLSFSRVSRSEMHKERVDFKPLMQEIIEEMSPETAGRAIDWNIHPLQPVVGNPAMLRLVWVNLVSNALKYSRPRKEAKIEIGQQPEKRHLDFPDEQIFYIRDNGVGFDMQYADKLFGVFQRLHHASEFEGTGIGLANVQRIIQRHGGRIWAESEVDKGATFYFMLPRIELESVEEPRRDYVRA